MKKGVEGILIKHKDQHTKFLHKSLQEGRPANLIIVLDTLSDTFSSHFQATSGLTGVSTALTLPDLLRLYVGEPIFNEMTKLSTFARSYRLVPELSPGLPPSADITPKVRGGWRVMVIVSCGSAVRNPVHWNHITELLEKYTTPV